MWWPRLKRRFPTEVHHKTFYRAVRSLRRMGRVRFCDDGRLRYLQAVPHVRLQGRMVPDEDDIKGLLHLLEDARCLQKTYGRRVAVGTYSAQATSVDVSALPSSTCDVHSPPHRD